MGIDKGLIGGSTPLMLLSLLDTADRYGYEIIKEIESRSDSTFQFKEGTLYPVLHKLEAQGYIRSYWNIGDSGKKRKYYQITKNGKKQLAKEKENWDQFTSSISKVIGGTSYALN